MPLYDLASANVIRVGGGHRQGCWVGLLKFRRSAVEGGAEAVVGEALEERVSTHLEIGLSPGQPGRAFIFL